MKDKTEKELTENLEDYLYDIFEILKTVPVVRIKDLAEKRKVKLPSAVTAAKSLAKKNLIHYKKYGYITLTEEGKKVAKKIEERKEVLYKFLTEVLKVNPETAERDVHKMEHDISKETLEKIVEFTKKLLK
ncbi:MAG: metal-dependent transcriptional regulator [Thermosulfidibacteraceae bacterium]|jgi:DtxR family Mn-dependent transcriptional regulator